MRAYRGLRRQRGFTYLWLLLGLALGAAALAAVGERSAQAVHREREAELEFRGREIARALAAYWAATPGAGKLPPSLEVLVEDRRGLTPRHHLRRLYSDPFTGLPDWVLVKNADGGIEGVHSRSEAWALRIVDMAPSPTQRRLRESDRLFRYDDSGATPPAPSSSAPNT